MPWSMYNTITLSVIQNCNINWDKLPIMTLEYPGTLLPTIVSTTILPIPPLALQPPVFDVDHDGLHLIPDDNDEFIPIPTTTTPAIAPSS